MHFGGDRTVEVRLVVKSLQCLDWRPPDGHVQPLIERSPAARALARATRSRGPEEVPGDLEAGAIEILNGNHVQGWDGCSVVSVRPVALGEVGEVFSDHRKVAVAVGDGVGGRYSGVASAIYRSASGVSIVNI